MRTNRLSDRSTDLQGFSLTMTRATLKAVVMARNGEVVADDATGLRFRLGKDEFAARFHPDDDSPHEIVAFLPPSQGSFAVYWSLVLRFGTQTQTADFPRRHWEGRDNVVVIYDPGRNYDQDPQLIRLIDRSRR